MASNSCLPDISTEAEAGPTSTDSSVGGEPETVISAAALCLVTPSRVALTMRPVTPGIVPEVNFTDEPDEVLSAPIELSVIVHE
jgi:hypothetical protein